MSATGELVSELMSRLIAVGVAPDEAARIVVPAVTTFSVSSPDTTKELSAAAKRMRKYRAKRNGASPEGVTERNESVTVTPRDATTLFSQEVSTVLSIKENNKIEEKETLSNGESESQPVTRNERNALRKRKVSLPLPQDFKPEESHYQKGAEYGYTRACVDETCEDMRVWAYSTDARKADWGMTLHGFIRRNAQNNRGRNGHFGSQDRANSFGGRQQSGRADVHAVMAEKMRSDPRSRFYNGAGASPGKPCIDVTPAHPSRAVSLRPAGEHAAGDVRSSDDGDHPPNGHTGLRAVV